MTEIEAFQKFVDLTGKYLEDIEKLAEEFPPLQTIVAESPLAEAKEMLTRARMFSTVLKQEIKDVN